MWVVDACRAYSAAMSAPCDVPPTQSIGTPTSSSARNAPRCARLSAPAGQMTPTDRPARVSRAARRPPRTRAGGGRTARGDSLSTVANARALRRVRGRERAPRWHRVDGATGGVVRTRSAPGPSPTPRDDENFIRLRHAHLRPRRHARVRLQDDEPVIFLLLRHPPREFRPVKFRPQTRDGAVANCPSRTVRRATASGRTLRARVEGPRERRHRGLVLDARGNQRDGHEIRSRGRTLERGVQLRAIASRSRRRRRVSRAHQRQRPAGHSHELAVPQAHRVNGYRPPRASASPMVSPRPRLRSTRAVPPFDPSPPRSSSRSRRSSRTRPDEHEHAGGLLALHIRRRPRWATRFRPRDMNRRRRCDSEHTRQQRRDVRLGARSRRRSSSAAPTEYTTHVRRSPSGSRRARPGVSRRADRVRNADAPMSVGERSGGPLAPLPSGQGTASDRVVPERIRAYRP